MTALWDSLVTRLLLPGHSLTGGRRQVNVAEPDRPAVFGPQVQPDAFAAGRLHEPEVPRAAPPLAEGDQDRDEAPALIGQDVVVVRAAVRRRGLFEDAGGDQFPEPGRQDVFGNAQTLLELAESPLAA